MTAFWCKIAVNDSHSDIAYLEQLRQRKPLTGHLVAVVGIHELVIVDAVGRIPFHTLDRWLARVEGDDVVDKGLAGGRERKALAGVRGVVFGGRGLADLELLTGCGRHSEGGGGGEAWVGQCRGCCWIVSED